MRPGRVHGTAIHQLRQFINGIAKAELAGIHHNTVLRDTPGKRPQPEGITFFRVTRVGRNALLLHDRAVLDIRRTVIIIHEPVDKVRKGTRLGLGDR